MKKILAATAATAALALAAPGAALAFNPQPDPPKVQVHVDLNLPSAGVRCAFGITIAFPPGPTSVLTPRPCAPAPPTTPS